MSKVIRYRIRLLQPVLVTALQGDPNEAVAFGYLPGSVLRGALIGRYLAQAGKPKLDEEWERAVFLRTGVRYLNAYPVIQDQRGLPTPRSWSQRGDRIYDELFSPSDPAQGKRKRIKEPFHATIDTNVTLRETPRHIAVHIERDRIGRPTAESGAVYRYDSLASQQEFEGIILCDDDRHAEWLKPLVGGRFWLGGARTAGYGCTEWSYRKTVSSAEWQELANSDHGANAILVTSNLLLRQGSTGAYSADRETLRMHLSSRLGLPAETITIDDCDLESEMIGGFNRTWGLPLPQTLTVKIGSVLRVTLPTVTQEQLSALLWYGIGERRGEGFGRVALYRQSTDGIQIAEVSSAMPSGITLTGGSAALASTIAQRISDARVTEHIRSQAQKIQIHNAPSKAQMNALRQVLSESLAFESPDPVLQYLESAASTSRRQFQQAEVGGKPLTSWLHEQLSTGEPIPVGEVNLGGQDAGLASSLRYRLRLIDAVLALQIRDLED